MLRAIRAVATACLLASAPLAVTLGHAKASELSDAYNHQTDRDFRVGLQMRLAWTGDYVGSFDGRIGPQTLRAIRDFQARKGMAADGAMSEAFLNALVEASDGAVETFVRTSRQVTKEVSISRAEAAVAARELSNSGPSCVMERVSTTLAGSSTV